ncbi:MAG: FkbM family methyltransferase [Chthoniobacterales bacterium]
MEKLTTPTTDLGEVTDNATLRSLYFNLLPRLQPDVCCDIGANNGEAALLAKAASPASSIYAFEANPEIYGRHSSRLAAEGIHYENLTLNSKGGEITIYAPRTLSKAWISGRVVDAKVVEPPDTGKTSLLLRNEAATYTEFNVASQRLDDFFRTERGTLDNTRFALWIDVEGAADAVLAGATEVLKSTALIFIELEGYPFWKEQKTASSVAERLRQCGFVPVARDKAFGDDQFNVLFLRPQYLQLLDEHKAVSPVSYPQSDLPVFIPSFNNPTYLRGMVEQLVRVGLQNITIVDNGSSYQPLLDYLDSVEGQFTVLRHNTNHGPRHFFRSAEFYEKLPQCFCLTDPDLALNPNLPADFVEHLTALVQQYRIGKAGFSLDISEPHRMRPELFQIGEQRYRIWEWEAQFWQTPLNTAGQDPAYRALIATTFAVYDKTFFRPETPFEAIRVAGRYTARHLPWYLDQQLPPEEAAYYRATSSYSYYCGEPPQH